MDFVNHAIAQVSDLFRSMTPGARLTAGLLLAVVVVSVGYLFQQGTAGPDAFLFGGQALSDGELTLIEAAVSQAGLSGHAREGNRLRVPAGQQAAYMAAVADGGALPRNFNTILENALDKGGAWESREQTRERLKIAKQQLLGEIVRQMPWVDEAVVVYDEEQARGLSSVKQVTATVNVKPALGEMLDPRRAKNLQTLIAKSVIGLRAEDVAVTNLGEGGPAGSGGEVYPEMFDDEYYRTKVTFELGKKRSIENALSDIPGVRVEVNAELDAIVEELTTNVTPDPKATMLREKTSTESSEQSTTAGGGQPGPFANGPNRQGTDEALQKQNINKTMTEMTETDNVVGQEQRTTRRAGYTLKEVWATVTVPSSHVENLWRQRNPDAKDPPKPDELVVIEDILRTDVENIVEPLLLLQVNKGEDTYKHVRVVVVDTLPRPTIEPPSMATQALAWTGRYWSTLAMLGVAMFSLLILRSVVKAGPSSGGAGPAQAGPTLKLDAPDAKNGDDETEAEQPLRPKLRLRKGHSLKDDLIEIVREDPDAAADILRTWIGKSA